jgi:uncharacterized delta-60 repeat protein
VTTDFTGIGGGDDAGALVLQPDGKLVAAGRACANFACDFALARYLPDGSLDPTFGVEGKVTTDLGGDNQAGALVLQPDGKLVVAGGAGGDFALARYESGLVLEVGPPTNKEECKHNEWRTFTIPRAFKNQGDCIQFVNTSK